MTPKVGDTVVRLCPRDGSPAKEGDRGKVVQVSYDSFDIEWAIPVCRGLALTYWENEIGVLVSIEERPHHDWEDLVEFV